MAHALEHSEKGGFRYATAEKTTHNVSYNFLGIIVSLFLRELATLA